MDDGGRRGPCETVWLARTTSRRRPPSLEIAPVPWHHRSGRGVPV